MKTETNGCPIGRATFGMCEPWRVLTSLWQDEEGQDLIEYSLLMVFVALVVLAIIGGIGTSLNTFWTRINSDLSSAAHATS